MSILMENAAKGQKKSMLTLYEENKKKVYGFCNILLENKEKAAAATTEVFHGAWEAIEERGISTEKKFTEYLMASAAKQCRNILDIKDASGLKKSTKQFLNKVYAGDIATGLAELHTALKKLDPVQRYVYLLVNAGNMDYRELGYILKVKDADAKEIYIGVVTVLADVLAESGSKLDVTEAKSLLEQAKKADEIPASVDEACKSKIKESAKSFKLDQKWILPISIIAVMVIGVLIIGGLEMKTAMADRNLRRTASDYGITLLNPDKAYYVDINVEDYGKVTILLDQEEAPLTAANFVSLAQSGFYDGLTFHRIMEGFMMQGGDPEGDGTGGSEKTIPGEFASNGFENGLSHKRGTISMARTEEPNSASSQFFIMQEDKKSLDGKYAAFGQVVEGMDIVDAICEAAKPTDDNGTIAADDQPVISYVTVRIRNK